MPTTTFDVAESAHDAHVSGASASYPVTSADWDGTFTAEATDRVLNRNDAGTFRLRNGLLRWDTSSLDDAATISAAYLKIWVSAVFNNDSRSLVAEWYDFGTADSSDLTGTVTSDAHAGTAISSITTGAVNTFELQNLSSINKTGFTGLRLHITGGSPSGHNEVQYSAFDHSTDPAPQLVVETPIVNQPETLLVVTGALRW